MFPSHAVTRIHFLLVLAVLASLFPIAAHALPASYRVTVKSPSATTLQVEAEMNLESATLSFMITSSPQLPNGQADLVSYLTVQKAGKPLDLVAQEFGDWTVVGANVGDRVKVAYEVALEHDQYDWGPGIDEVGYRTDEGVFLTGSSLFLVPGRSLPEGAEIRFELPPEWTASTPWPFANGVFVAHTSNGLLRNCMFLGSHRTHVVELDGFRFTMVMGGDL